MSVIEYESGISNITQGLQQVRKDFYCRVFLLYANWLDAITIFDEVRRQEMDQSDFVWIISEQVSLRFYFVEFYFKTITNNNGALLGTKCP